MRTVSFFLLFAFCISNASAGTLLINEIAPATSGDDWVELFFSGECGESIDISHYHVTMYYGTSEPLSEYPITLYACDRAETPYDDRFAVVHLTVPGTPDETDITGDTNLNGYIDIYCNNYTGSLWNTDCVIAIDTDNDSSNGGIIDFVAFSNRDGSLNSSIGSYLTFSQQCGQWEAYVGENPQLCMIDIGASGLLSHQSIARISAIDSNSKEDFTITNFQTPGKPNIFSDNTISTRLFDVPQKRITILPGHPVYGRCEIPILVLRPVSVRLRVFSPIGILLFESPLQQNVPPGTLRLTWDLQSHSRSAGSGLYLAIIEATNSALRRSQRETVYIIISRYQ